jgi:hypothetical protein
MYDYRRVELEASATGPAFLLGTVLWATSGQPPISDVWRWPDVPVISPSESVQCRGRQLFDLVITHDLEGIVAKK